MPEGHMMVKNDPLLFEQRIVFSLIFSKKIHHWRSLHHMSLDIYHRFVFKSISVSLIPETNLLIRLLILSKSNHTEYESEKRNRLTKTYDGNVL